MKLFILMALIVFIGGCSRAPLRTGSLCVTPFNTLKYSTSDPVEVKQDVVDQIEPQLRKEVLRKILDETKLSIKTDCSSFDYILNAYIRRVDSMVAVSMRGFFKRTGITQRAFSIGVSGELLDNNKKRLVVFDVDNGGEVLPETLEHIGEEIADAIKTAEVPVPPLL